MTIPREPTEAIIVTQADRMAAWPHRPSCYKESDKAAWMDGAYDGHDLIQAFARHATPKPVEEADVREAVRALERLSALTPNNANARTADDLYATVKAIADTALARLQSPQQEERGADDAQFERECFELAAAKIAKRRASQQEEPK